MTDTTPAAELRNAAARLRAHLTDPQLTPGPWLSLDHGDRLLRNQPGDEDRAPVYVVDEPMSNGANADYIELVHPGVGAALAAWLDSAAHGWEALQLAAKRGLDPTNPDHVKAARLLNDGPYDAQDALALARLINATES
ncbi:hypothetical protein [Actinacidiphila sp. ITFR-21]|uniref:hypothetical protein n=1 Tax=Actinacidiphila sp. ITFR-21 TaxID=3075199 RepID=UPI00288AE5DC|nr:hypothetical protein [Streptomyces sp. ITFR-21]WNI15560.1 hypothetical protein RLT57_08490 [Streptomyces sp. ITFR-21]